MGAIAWATGESVVAEGSTTRENGSSGYPVPSEIGAGPAEGSTSFAGSSNPNRGVSERPSRTAGHVAHLRVTAFTEVYRPIRNGVTASIDALLAGCGGADIALTVVTPSFPHAAADGPDIVRLPSWPLPTPTAYRLCLPVLPRRARIALAASDVIHAHSPFVTGAIALRAARAHKLPLVFTYHTRLDQYAHYAPLERNLSRRLAIALTRGFADAATIVVVPTRAIEVRLREIGVGVPIRVVPSGIDVERFASGARSDTVRARLGAGSDDRLVLLVSRLGREKNVRLAIEALARIPDGRVRLALVGDGPARRELIELARVHGVGDRVAFLGALAPAELPNVYASADAFAFPSLSETQGLVLAEAMVAGLPIAAVSTPVTREVLAGYGTLARPDSARFADAILTALSQEHDRSAAHLAFERFSVRVQAERMAAVYAEARERNELTSNIRSM